MYTLAWDLPTRPVKGDRNTGRTESYLSEDPRGRVVVTSKKKLKLRNHAMTFLQTKW